MTYKPNFDELELFWQYIKPDDNDSYVEIRVTFDCSREYFNLIKDFKKQNPDILVKKSVQFFIQTFDQLKRLLEFNNYYLANKVKICYGLNLRKKVDNDIGGGYKYIDNFRFIFFDIDMLDNSKINLVTERDYDVFVNNLTVYLEQYNLYNPVVISSGIGRHILYRIKDVKVTDARKLWYKDFVKYLMSKFTHFAFKLDAISDATRVFGLPETTNVKRVAHVKILKIARNVKINNFKFKSKRKVKVADIKPGYIDNVKISDFGNVKEYILNNILVKKLLTEKLPEGDRNNILIYSLKIMLKQCGYNESDEFVNILFNKIYEVQGERFPSNFPEGNVTFSKKYVNSYFKKHNMKEIFR